VREETGIKKGIFLFVGKPTFLLSADYPYYRDSAANWEDRLKKLKEANIDIITAYIPWRHHAQKEKNGKIIYDFDGKTQDNRNLHKFIKLSEQLNLYLILKPGPFIHAEVNYGGLPDWVCPQEDKDICPMLNFKKEPFFWFAKTVPSPFDEKFLKLTLEWLAKVDKEIFSKITYPQGNLIGIQIANEGIYSNGPNHVSDCDYSVPGLRLYEKFLKQKYPHIKSTTPPTGISGVKTKEEIFKLMAWSDFQGFYYKKVLENWKHAIKSKAQFMVNINPPYINDVDSWLSRNIPEELEELGISYGYTDWMGLPQEDKTIRSRYLFITRRATGSNLEDNWGFSKLYDERYKYPEVPFYQSLFTVACGAKGFNVYTGVSTDHWDVSIDNQHEIPYPASSPISENGERGEKYKILQLAGNFFKEHGQDFLESSPYKPFSWGLYLPYAHICAWFKKREEFREAELKEVSCANALIKFADGLYARNLGFDVLNLQFEKQEALNLKKTIVLEGGFFMDEETQTKLSNYVKQGGVLVITKELPKLNEYFEDCDKLRKCLKEHGKGRIILIEQDKDLIKTLIDEVGPENKIISENKDLGIFFYEHKNKDTQFLFVFNEADQERFVEFKINQKKIGLNMAKKSASIIKIENGSLKAVLINATSQLYNSKITPKFTLDNETFEVNKPADLYAVKEKGNWKIQKV